MTFGLIDQPQDESNKTTPSMDMAKRLLNAIKVRGLSNDKPADLNQWSNHFTALSKQHDNVKEVLDWYIQHIGEEFMPVAYSASGFRTKFHQIKQLMGNDIVDVILNEDEANGVRRLTDVFGSLKGVKSQLAFVFRRSADNYDNFNNKIIEFRAKKSVAYRHHEFLNNCSAHGRVGTNKRYWTENTWLGPILSILSRWRNFNGDLRPYIFTPRSPWLARFGHEWAMEWANDERLWDEVIKEVMR